MPSPIILTPLASDDFHRADAPTLGPNWMQDTGGDDSCSIVSDQCLPNATDLFGFNYYSAVSAPDDQYASITVQACTDNNAFVTIQLRATIDGQNGYYVLVGGPLGTPNAAEVDVALFAAGSTTKFFYQNAAATVNPGDVFTIAAVGTTLYVFQNEVLLAQATDGTYASGVIFIEAAADTEQTDAIISNFVMGGAKLNPSGASGGNIDAGFGFSTDMPGATAADTGGTAIVTRKTAIMTTKFGSRIIG